MISARTSTLFKSRIRPMNASTLLKMLGFCSLSILVGCAPFSSGKNARQQAAVLPVVEPYWANQAGFSQATPVQQWWQQLNDSLLTEFIDQSFSVNHDIRVAVARLQESKALLQHSRWQAWPSITADASATRQKVSADITGQTTPLITEQVQAGFSTAWELDLFGRTQNQITLAQAQLRARQADVKATQISLAAEVASVYLNIRGLQKQLDIAQQSVQIQQQYATLVQQQKAVGRASSLQEDQINTQLNLALAQLPTLQQPLNIAIQRLSVLCVLTPENINERIHNPAPWPNIPTSVAIGKAADWIKRRPDVASAEQALQGAVAEYNIHLADLYPRITLMGQFGYLSTEWQHLGRESSETFTFSPILHWAAFDLTRVKAQIAASDARTQVRLAQFEQTVLTALEETQNAFTRFREEESRNQHLKIALSHSTRVADAARDTYRIGAGDLNHLLEAENLRLITAQQWMNSETLKLLNLIDIYKNLGGGWEFENTKV